ncbi:hypothetical protein B9479_002960 [Cryptococcus floricola]|uniref:Uncharacterized protein n=1 Tax=Cryptococcus floricola TaxID=2591691 RepID=A0A5D3B0L9_9TREE|nr:hypothetical protein B9479_002960 [Cryptococcus floricola]
MPGKNERPTISTPSNPSGTVWGEQTNRPRHTAGSAVPQASVWGNDPSGTRFGNAPSAERQYDAGSPTSSDGNLVFQGASTTASARTRHDMTTSRFSFGSTQPPSSAGPDSPPSPDWPRTQRQQQRYQPPMASRFSSDTDDRRSSTSDRRQGSNADRGMRTGWYDSSPERERRGSNEPASAISAGSASILIGFEGRRESIKESDHEDDK